MDKMLITFLIINPRTFLCSGIVVIMFIVSVLILISLYYCKSLKDVFEYVSLFSVRVSPSTEYVYLSVVF